MRTSNELQLLDLRIGYQISRASDNHQGDVSLTRINLMKGNYIDGLVQDCNNSSALLSGVPDYFGRNKISSGGDLSHYSSASLY